MGGLLNRSTAVQGEVKTKKSKRKRRHQRTETPFETDAYLVYDGKENETPQIYYHDSHQSWNKKYEGQQQLIGTNVNYQVNPNAYSSNYSADQNGFFNQGWASPVNANYSVYPMNTFPILSPRNSEQYERIFPLSEMNNNQSKMVIHEERSLKRVQFSPPVEQSMPLKPLSSAQSWHEVSQIPPSTTTAKFVPLKAQASVSTGVLTTSTNRRSMEKPIYIGVDFSATLAERSQTKSAKHRRSRSHTHHHQKRSTSTSTPVLNMENKPDKPIDFQQPTRISTSAGKLEQNLEIKPMKSRSNRRQQQLPMGNNQVKQSRSRQQKRSQRSEQLPTQISNSISNIPSSTRPTDTPVIRMPLAPLDQQQLRSQK